MRATAEWALVRSGLPSIARSRRRADTLILAYHNIVPDGAAASGDRSLHLPQSAFAAQLDLLRATHDIVPLADALRDARDARARGGRPRAVITFDDAYRGAVTAGVRELAARGLPATIFVAPAFVGDGTFWWDVLTPPEAEGIDTALRARALDEWRGMDGAVRAGARALGAAEHPVPPHARCASEGELRHAMEQPGLTLGSHSWSHPNLARLQPGELAEELRRPLAWLRERFDRVSATLSYPYGLASPETERAAAEAGYEAALRIDGGWMPPSPPNPHALPRLNVPAGLSRHGFVLRAAGVLER